MALPEDPEGIYELLLELYTDGSAYNGTLSQRAHAEQAAAQAAHQGQPDEVVVAALLHDVGWKTANPRPAHVDVTPADADFHDTAPGAESLARELGILSCCAIDDGASAEDVTSQHDVVGATLLRMLGFTETIPALVEGHVLAKRWMVARIPDYFNQLSRCSKTTLAKQGGSMTDEEAKLFETDELFNTCIEMRKWDEGGKVLDLEVPPFEHYKDRIIRCLTNKPVDAETSKERQHFMRQGNTLVGIRPL